MFSYEIASASVLTLLISCCGALFSTAQGQVLSTFGSGSGTLVENDGNTAAFLGAFVDYPAFTPTTNANYGGVIGVGARYNEPSANDASMTIYGNPGSVRLASGAGAAFASPSDWNLSLTFDFRGLAPGSLIAGTQFSVIDLDGNSNIGSPVGSTLYNVVARDLSGAVITTPWLTGMSSTDLGLDPTSPGQPSPVFPADYPTVTESGGSYTFLGQAYATATPVLSGFLTQNVSAIEMTYFGSQLDNTQISFAGVPEPSGVVFLMAAALVGGLKRSRPRSSAQRLAHRDIKAR